MVIAKRQNNILVANVLKKSVVWNDSFAKMGSSAHIILAPSTDRIPVVFLLNIVYYIQDLRICNERCSYSCNLITTPFIFQLFPARQKIVEKCEKINIFLPGIKMLKNVD